MSLKCKPLRPLSHNTDSSEKTAEKEKIQPTHLGPVAHVRVYCSFTVRWLAECNTILSAYTLYRHLG